MRRLTRLTLLRLAEGQVLVHVSGIWVLALAVAVEGADLPARALLDELLRRLPGLWAAVAPALSLLGGAFAASRARRDGTVLALGTFGVGPGRAAGYALLLGAGLGLAAGQLAVAPTPPATAWSRGEGGWFRGGVAVPDVPGGEVRERPPPAPERARPAVSSALTTLAGGALGLWAGAPAVLVVTPVWLVADVLARALVERGAAPAWAAWTPSLALLLLVALLVRRAPLFPARGR